MGVNSFRQSLKENFLLGLETADWLVMLINIRSKTINANDNYVVANDNFEFQQAAIAA